MRVGGRAEHAGDGLRGDLDRGQVALGAAAHEPGAHGAERGGQPPDPGLARVAADEGGDRLWRLWSPIFRSRRSGSGGPWS